MRVFLTVDTEIWPFASGWPVRPLLPEKRDFCAEVRGYIYGDTTAGSFGIPYQLELLSRYGLKASYFVEPLFSERAGSSKLREIVDLIQEGRQEVQLHLHTEWIGELANPRLPARFRQHVREFEPDEQFAILREALALLRGAGARQPSDARRAGAQRHCLRHQPQRLLSRFGLRDTNRAAVVPARRAGRRRRGAGDLL
jgi:hypothetical protein